MPIVTDKIIIEIDGKVDDLIADSNRAIKQLDEIKAHTKTMGEKSIKQAQDMERASKQSAISITDFRSAYQIVLDVMRVGQQVWGATIDEMVAYGDQVKKLQTITGQSVETVSNQIQLADDARVSYESLATAMRTASKKGIDTSMSGLASLSDEYKKLQPGIERTQFLMEKFGRSGVEMGKILEMDSKAIRDFKANSGQILSEADMRNIKEYNHGLDGMKDRFESLKGNLSKKLIPVGTFATDAISLYIDAFDIMKTKHVNFIEAMNMAARGINEEKAAFMAAGDAADGAGESIDGLADSQAAAEEKAKSLTNVYQGLLSSMFSIQQANDGYAKTVDDLARKDEELKNKKDQLTLAMWQEQQAGKLTNDENLRYVQQMAEITAAQEDNAKAKENAEKDAKKASDQRVYDLAQQKLAADGVVSSGEYEYLQNLAVSMGLVSRASADQAIAESNRADALVENFAQTLPPMERSLLLMQQMASYNGTMVNFGVNFQSNMPQTYNVPGAHTNRPNPQAQPGGYGYQYGGSRDSGGSGVAGTAYMIGTGAQPELFTPSTNGTFTPANQMGSTYNIVVNNPKKETAENSIRTALKKLSYTGVAA